MIRLATMRDINAVETMYRELLTHEARYGSNSNWVLDLYPTRETAVNGCLEQTLYVLLDEGVFCASMILNQLQPVEYKKIKWAYPAAPEDILVIHTLCVPPQQAGKGYGKQMVRYAIQKARVSGSGDALGASLQAYA